MDTEIKKAIDGIIAEWKKGCELEAALMNDIQYEQFNNTLLHFVSVFGNLSEEQEVLDVVLQGEIFRFSIKGADEISAFCKSDQLPSNNVTIMSKKPIQKKDLKDLSVRVRLSEEVQLANNNDNRTIYHNAAGKMKHYRLKKRYTVKLDDTYRADFTIVKSFQGTNFKKNMSFSRQTYEIEIEYTGQKAPSSESLMDYVFEALKSLYNETYFLSSQEKSKVLEEYKSVVGPFLSYKNHQKTFIGPNLVTLERQNIIPNAEDLSVTPNILVDYTVTEKADGERILVYIDSVGAVYMINNRMNIMATGLTSSKYKKTILDAEKVVTNDGSLAILCFDAYIRDGDLVADLPLVQVSKGKSKDSRYVICKDVVQSIKSSDVIKIQAKTLKSYNGIEEFCSICAMMLNQGYDYHTDGLIFTPASLVVGSTKLSQKVTLGGTWEHVFKWKPPSQNTIDFQVVASQPKIKRVDDETGKMYMEFNLFVGSVVCTPKDFIENSFSKTNRNYKPKLFDFAPTVKIYLDDSINLPRCINFDNIYDGMIVEMAYDISTKSWIPLRARYDKYEQYVKTKEITANSYQNALSVWRTIQNPISKDILTKPGEIKKLNITEIQPNEEQKYYSRIYSRDKSATLPMLTFHNYWIKNRMLLTPVRGKRADPASLLDLGCGKGGDLNKWIDNNYTTVVGIDISQDNIINPIDGIYNRISQNKYYQKHWTYVFLPLNAGAELDAENVNNIKDEYTRNLASVMLGLRMSFQVQNFQKYAGLLKPSSYKYDVVSCQFAIHYFYENAEKFETFIKNAVSRMKPGGHFIGTCFDGKAVDKLFKSEQSEKVVGGNGVWRLHKLYDKYSSSAYGQRIGVYIETINQYIEEFLVDFDNLVTIFRKYGLRLLNVAEIEKLRLPDSTQTFDKSFIEMERAKKEKTHKSIELASTMRDYEKKFSFLNRWFIFVYDPKSAKSEPKLPSVDVEEPEPEKPKEKKKAVPKKKAVEKKEPVVVEEVEEPEPEKPKETTRKKAT